MSNYVRVHMAKIITLAGFCIFTTLLPVKLLAETAGGFPIDGGAFPTPTVLEKSKLQYWVMGARSVEGLAEENSITAVEALNTSKDTCDVMFRFFYATSTTKQCQESITLTPNQTANFCTRGEDDLVGVSCYLTCDPELTYHTGNIKVLSNCESLGVHANVIYRNQGGTQVVGARNLNVLKASKNTKTKGD